MFASPAIIFLLLPSCKAGWVDNAVKNLHPSPTLLRCLFVPVTQPGVLSGEIAPTRLPGPNHIQLLLGNWSLRVLQSLTAVQHRCIQVSCKISFKLDSIATGLCLSVAAQSLGRFENLPKKQGKVPCAELRSPEARLLPVPKPSGLKYAGYIYVALHLLLQLVL